MEYCCSLFKHHIIEDDIAKTNHTSDVEYNYYEIESYTGNKLFPILFCPFCGYKLEETLN